MTCVFAEASCARVACVFRPWITLLTLSNRSYPINIMHILFLYVVKNVRMLQGFDSFLRTISMVMMLYGSIMILIWTEDGFLNGRKTEATLALVITGNKIELAKSKSVSRSNFDRFWLPRWLPNRPPDGPKIGIFLTPDVVFIFIKS